MRIVSFALVLSLISSTVASAQPALTPPTSPSLMPAPAPLTLRRPKNPDTAYLLSSVGTLVPIGIFIAGLRSNENNAGTVVLLSTGTAIFAPAAGHWYAERFWTTGTAIRMVGATAAGLAVARLVEEDDGGGRGAEILFFAGLGAMAVGALWDIATAGEAVNDWNRDHASSLAPTVMKTGSGFGVGFAGSF